MASNNVRNIILNGVLEHIEKKDVFVVNSDYSGGLFIQIDKSYPERYVQVGIAEQNMIAVACGLALAGKFPITYAISPFSYSRAFDQIRTAVSTMDLKIVMIGNHMGVGNPSNGASHYSTELFGLISLLPNVEYCAISDESLATSVTEYIFNDLKHPIYLGIDFFCDETIKSEDVDMNKGWRFVGNNTGRDTVIITHGHTTRIASDIDFKTKPTIIELFKKPYDKTRLSEELRNYKKIIVADEHQLHGGLGSEMVMLLSGASNRPPVNCLCLDFSEGFPDDIGTRDYIVNKYGVSKNSLLEAVEGGI